MERPHPDPSPPAPAAPAAPAHWRFSAVLALVATLIVSPGPARGNGGSMPPPPSSTPSSFPAAEEQTPEERLVADRRQAEDLYRSAYKDVEHAKAEWQEADSLAVRTDAKAAENAKKKRDSATRRFGKALEGFQSASKLAPDFADAWNMVGYCYRRTGDLEKSFQAYWECLKLKPDHEGAHEYLGEAYLLAGQPDRALSELAWLRERKSLEAANLEASLARYRKDHPAAPAAGAAGAGGTTGAGGAAGASTPAPASPATPAPTDSASGTPGGH